MKTFDNLKENMEKSLDTMKKAKDNSTRMVELEGHKTQAIGDIASVFYMLDQSLNTIAKQTERIADYLENLESIEGAISNIDGSVTLIEEHLEKTYREYRTK